MSEVSSIPNSNHDDHHHHKETFITKYIFSQELGTLFKENVDKKENKKFPRGIIVFRFFIFIIKT